MPFMRSMFRLLPARLDYYESEKLI